MPCPNPKCPTNVNPNCAFRGSRSSSGFDACTVCRWTDEPGVKTIGEWLCDLGFESPNHGRSVLIDPGSEFLLSWFSKGPKLASSHYRGHNAGLLQVSCGGKVIMTFAKTSYDAETTNCYVAIVVDHDSNPNGDQLRLVLIG